MPVKEIKTERYELLHKERLTLTILSDTHGLVDERIVELAGQSDVILHAGDIMNGEILQQLRFNGSTVIAVQGNNDTERQWKHRHLEDLHPLPEIVHMDLPGGCLTMEHGHRIWDIKNYHSRLRTKHPHARVIVYGHTHVEAIDQETVPWVINPGAAGRIRTHGGPSCLQLTVSPEKWKVQRFKFELLPLRRSA